LRVERPNQRRSPTVRRRQDEPGEVYAAIDLGTNNCRLLVARPAQGGFRVIDSFSRIVRLGEGLHSTGELAIAAIERSIAALRVCAGKIRRRRVTRARCVATEACRQAANGSYFLERVASETGPMTGRSSSTSAAAAPRCCGLPCRQPANRR
jgi:exopolyphosphatase / guanosine-5'-triphosphate,3'-diphosphate pyrophosphatase